MSSEQESRWEQIREQAPPGFQRPDHEDFWRLVEIVAEGLDKKAEVPGFDFETFIAAYVDVQSLSYLALQRVLRGFQINDPLALAQQMDSVMRVVALYLEGFTVGVEYERSRVDGQAG